MNKACIKWIFYKNADSLTAQHSTTQKGSVDPQQSSKEGIVWNNLFSS